MTTKKKGLNLRAAIEKEDALEREISPVLNPRQYEEAVRVGKREELQKLTSWISQALTAPDLLGADIFLKQRLELQKARDAAVRFQLTAVTVVKMPTPSAIVDELARLSPEACAHVAALVWDVKQLTQTNERLTAENRTLQDKLDEHRLAQQGARTQHPAFQHLYLRGKCGCGQ